MQTQSVVINKIIKILAALNVFFEHSLLYRALCAVKRAAGKSVALTGFLNTDYRDYWQGSFLFRFIHYIGSGIALGLGRLVRFIAKANEKSLNRRVYKYVVSGAYIPAICVKAVKGCAPVRLADWFYGTGERVEPLTLVYMLFLTGSLLVPAHRWSNMLLLASAVLFAGLFLCRYWLNDAGKERISFSKIAPSLLVFVFFCALSIVTGFGGSDSARVFVIFFACAVHSLIVVHVMKSLSDVKLFAKLIATALALTALFGFYQLYMGIEIRPEFTDLVANPGLVRLYAAFGNPNNDAKAWSMLFPFALAAAVAVKCDMKRVILAGAALLCLAAFMLTYSRAGYVALMAGIGVFILMSAPRLVPIALLALLLAIPFLPAGIIDRLLTLGSDTSSLYRFRIWDGVVRMLRDYWVSGVGLGPAAFIRLYRVYQDPLAHHALHAHNTFLDIIVHSGIGAFLAFMAFLFRQFKRGISAHMASRNKEYKIYMAAGVASLTAFVVFGVGEYVFFYPRVMLVFWVLAGLCGAIAHIGRTDEAPL